MKRVWKTGFTNLLCLVFAMPLLAAVEGVVTNGTTGKPQSGAQVTLTELGQGMRPIGSATTDAQGRFRFPDATLSSSNSYLLQAGHNGINYNRMLPPGPPPAELQIQVFDAVPSKGEAKVTQDMILLEPTGQEINVSQSVVWENNGKTTFQDPAGSFKFFLPEAAGGQVSVSVVVAGGMPLNRQAEKTREPNVWAVKYPIKPGETRFDLQYRLPAQETFEARVLHGGGPVRVIAPKGVKFIGEGLTEVGPEPRTQATIYDASGSKLAFKIEGTGTLRAGANAAEGGETASAQKEAAADPDVPQIEEKKPRIYDRIYPVMGFLTAIFALGAILLARSKQQPGTAKGR
jgi:hypothetical protein